MTDHVHPDTWTKTEQHRFEDRVSQELHNMRVELRNLSRAVLIAMGGLAVLVFLINLFQDDLMRAIP